MPLLEEMLPQFWNQNHWDADDELETAVKLALTSVSHVSPRKSCEEHSPEEKLIIRETIDKIRNIQDDRYARALELAGLKSDVMRARARELSEFCSTGDLDDFRLDGYAPAISFIESIFGEDLSGRNILEIGTETAGIKILGYLASKGAVVYGLDEFVVPDPQTLKEKNVNFFQGRWETASRYFQPGQMDLIYVQFMENHPEFGGPCDIHGGFNASGYDTKEARYKRKLTRNLFEEAIAREMEIILKKAGLFIMRNLNQELERKSEFVLHNPQLFENYGFKHYSFRFPFGNYLEVFQKK